MVRGRDEELEEEMMPCSYCVGVAVDCVVCGQRKKPIGRAAPLAMANSLCGPDCRGYRIAPYPGDLWPHETREEFGFGVDPTHECEGKGGGNDETSA